MNRDSRGFRDFLFARLRLTYGVMADGELAVCGQLCDAFPVESRGDVHA